MDSITCVLVDSLKEKFGNEEIPYTELKSHLQKVKRIPSKYLWAVIKELCGEKILEKYGTRKSLKFKLNIELIDES